MHLARVNQAPAIPEAVGVVALHMEALVRIVLEHGHRVVPALDEEVHRLRAEERRVEAIEEDWPATALRVSDFSREDRLARRAPAPIPLEVAVAQFVHD